MRRCTHDPAQWKAHWWAADKLTVGEVLYHRPGVSPYVYGATENRGMDILPWHARYNDELSAWLILSRCTVRRAGEPLRYRFVVAKSGERGYALPPLVDVKDESCPECWRTALRRVVEIHKGWT